MRLDSERVFELCSSENFLGLLGSGGMLPPPPPPDDGLFNPKCSKLRKIFIFNLYLPNFFGVKAVYPSNCKISVSSFVKF